ncbi:MAG: HIT family protein [Candidatus Woesearchaeota archaeon]
MAVTQELVNEIKAKLEGLSPEEQQVKLQEILAELPEEDRIALTGGGGGGGAGGGQQGGQCPFCSMAEGKIPVKMVYEDDVCMGVLDINPANAGHVLLFPKAHAQLTTQIEDNDFGHIMKAANKISSALFETLKAEGTNIIVQNGAAAGQTAPHALVHIIPRYSKDGVQVGWQPKKQSEEEMDATLAKIKEKNISVKKEDIVIKQEPLPVRKVTSRDKFRMP